MKKVKCIWVGNGYNPIVGEPFHGDELEVGQQEYRILKKQGVVKDLPKESKPKKDKGGK